MMHACPSSLEEMSAELHLWEETLALILHFEKNRWVSAAVAQNVVKACVPPGCCSSMH